MEAGKGGKFHKNLTSIRCECKNVYTIMPV